MYVKDSPEARALLKQYNMTGVLARPFRNQLDGATWIDVPFMFDPWWENRATR